MTFCYDGWGILFDEGVTDDAYVARCFELVEKRYNTLAKVYPAGAKSI